MIRGKMGFFARSSAEKPSKAIKRGWQWFPWLTVKKSVVSIKKFKHGVWEVAILRKHHENADFSLKSDLQAFPHDRRPWINSRRRFSVHDEGLNAERRFFIETYSKSRKTKFFPRKPNPKSQNQLLRVHTCANSVDDDSIALSSCKQSISVL